MPITDQLKIFRMSRSLYKLSLNIRKQYKEWWDQCINDRYTFDNLKFVEYIYKRLVMKRSFRNDYWILEKVCKSYNVECIKFIINKRRIWLYYGLEYICETGNIELVKFFISKCQTNDWNSGLYAACKNGSIECVQLMIDMGADEWEMGLLAACKYDNTECVDLMIKMGATECRYCEQPIEHH